MEALLKAAQKGAAKLGNEVQKHAQDAMRQSQLEERRKSKDCREVIFKEGPLGFACDGAIVSAVAPGGQADRLGIRIWDELLAIDGYAVPRDKDALKQWLADLPRPGTLIFSAAAPQQSGATPAPKVPADADKLGSTESAKAAELSIKDLLAEAATLAGEASKPPPPITSAPDRETGPAEAAMGTQFAEASEGAGVDETMSGVALRDALEQVRELETQLEESRRECQALRHLAAQGGDGAGTAQPHMEVRAQRLQDQLGRARAECENLRHETVELRSRLQESEARCEGLRQAVAHDDEVERESAEGRLVVLEEEVTRLRAALGAAELERHALGKKSEEAAADAAQRMADFEAEARRRDEELRALSVAEASAQAEVRELRALGAAQTEALATASSEAERATGEARLREEAAAKELQDLRAQLASLGCSAESGRFSHSHELEEKEEEEEEEEDEEDDFSIAEPILSGRPALEEPPADLPQPSDVSDSCSGAESKELVQLRAHVAELERRCISQQRKLNARPIVCRAFKPDGGSQDALRLGTRGVLRWEPALRATLGPQASGFVVRAYNKTDGALRSTTERLLRNSAFLWIFYAHILVLYTISYSCYTQATAVSGTSPADVLGTRVQQASMRGMGGHS